MKKILTFTVVMIFAIIALSTNVSAAEASTEADLEVAVAGTDEKITLTGDIVLSKEIDIKSGRNVTIDLNGFSITAADSMTYDSLIVVHNNGTLTITDSSTAQTGKIIAENGSARIAIKMTKSGDISTDGPATLIVENGTVQGTDFGISGNGYRHNTDIFIKGGKIKATASDGIGIYQPQSGWLAVEDGYIEGATGIEIRSGVLIVEGGTIIGTTVPTSVQANGNGGTTLGAGIAIAQHTTQNNIDVKIVGGTVKGYTAVSESNPQGNVDIENTSRLEIFEGTFEAINGGTTPVNSENFTGFIKGGVFNKELPKEYISDTLVSNKDENGNIYVGTLRTITVEKSENGKVEASLDKAVAGQKVKLTVAPDEGYELEEIYLDYEIEKISLKGNEFIMFDRDVKIVAKFKAIEKVEEPKLPVEDEKDETPKTGSIDTVLFASTIVAMISVAGIVTVKKYNR